MILEFDLAEPTASQGFRGRFEAWLEAQGINHFKVHELADAGRLTSVPRGDDEASSRARDSMEAVIGGPLPPTARFVRLAPPPAAIWDDALPLLRLLGQLRAETRAPLDVSSCYRDDLYNAAVGGAPHSTHRRFIAADIQSREWSPKKVADWLEAHSDAGRFGIGRYRTFTHIDTRGTAARFGRAA